MTLNVRIRTTNTAIHFSDGRKSINGVPIEEHCKKTIAKENFIISFSGVLDDADTNGNFDAFARINSDLVFKTDYIHLREDLFILINDEYGKDTTHGYRHCLLLISFKDPNGNITFETLKIIFQKCNSILFVRFGQTHPLSIRHDVIGLNQVKGLFRPDFLVDQLAVADTAIPDYEVDFDHLYSDGANTMPTEVKRVIPTLFMSAFHTHH